MCSPAEGGGDFWVGSGEGCEIRLDDRDIGKKHTGLRVDAEGIVWIMDMGGRGGTRMIGSRLMPHSERRLRGNAFWCGRKGRHFRISRSIPSPGDFRAEDSPGDDDWGGKGFARHEERLEDPAERKGDVAGSGVVSPRAVEGAEIWFDDAMERGQVNDFVLVWKDEGRVHHHLLRDGSSCWLGEGEGPRIARSTSVGCMGRLEATRGLLSLTTERPALVRGLEEAEGVGSSSAPTTFRIQRSSFMILGTEFYCHRVCFSPD